MTTKTFVIKTVNIFEGVESIKNLLSNMNLTDNYTSVSLTKGSGDATILITY